VISVNPIKPGETMTLLRNPSNAIRVKKERAHYNPKFDYVFLEHGTCDIRYFQTKMVLTSRRSFSITCTTKSYLRS